MTISRILRSSSLLLGLTVFGAAACGGDAKTDGANPVTGALVGGTVPAGTKVVVIWSVSSGSPDYAYKFGDGKLSGTEYVVTLGSSPPPKEAINSYGVGIGVVVLLDAKVPTPDGKMDEATTDSILGLSPRHAVIWRAEDATDLDWSGAFPRGYSCGHCVDAPDGEIFDSFEPVECTGVDVQVGETDDVCNWT